MEPSPYLPTLAPLLQPALPPRRADPGVRRPVGRRPDQGRGPRDRRPPRPRRRRRDRPRHLVDREARGAARSCTRCRAPPAASSTTPPSGARHGNALLEFAAWRVIAQEHGPDYRDLAGRAAGRGVARGRRLPRRTRRRRRPRGLAAVGARRAARRSRRPRPCRPAWHWAPCTTSRSACTPAVPTRGGCGRRTPPGSRSAHPRTRSTRSGQDWSQPPWRPGRARGAGLRAAARHGARGADARRRGARRPRDRAVPAVVDPGGRCRPARAPTSATTTRR